MLDTVRGDEACFTGFSSRFYFLVSPRRFPLKRRKRDWAEPCILLLFGTLFLVPQFFKPPAVPAAVDIQPEGGVTPDTQALYGSVPHDPHEFLSFLPTKVKHQATGSASREMAFDPLSVRVDFSLVTRIRVEDFEDPDLNPNPPFVRVRIVSGIRGAIVNESFGFPITDGKNPLVAGPARAVHHFQSNAFGTSKMLSIEPKVSGRDIFSVRNLVISNPASHGASTVATSRVRLTPDGRDVESVVYRLEHRRPDRSVSTESWEFEGPFTSLHLRDAAAPPFPIQLAKLDDDK